MARPSPTAACRALGFRLRRYRLAHDNPTLGAVAKRVGMGASSIGRAESGEQALIPAVVEKILDYFGVADSAERAVCLDLAVQARKRGPWAGRAPLLNSTFLSLEDAATEICCLDPATIPGLLQTREYFRVLAQTQLPGVSEAELDSRTDVRMERQLILTRDDPCQLQVVLDEAVLHRVVGAPGVMAEQFEHLITMARRHNVEIQVLPFSEGEYGVAAGFTILRFEEPTDPGTVYLEHPHRDEFVDGAAEVARFDSLWSRLRAIAASPTQSLRMLRAARDRFIEQGKDG